MHDPLHASRDANRGLSEAQDHLAAADAAEMHRLLAWYYRADEPHGQHLPYPHVEDRAA